MLSLVWMSGLVIAAEPPSMEVRLSASPTHTHLRLVAPEGHHIAPDAPFFAQMTVGGAPWSVDTVGAMAQGGVTVPAPSHRPLLVEGSLSVSICDDAGTACAVVQQDVQGIIETRRSGEIVLSPVTLEETSEITRVTSLEATLATTPHDIVLVDFTAIWCPPCNLLGAEVLHAAEPPDVLQEMTVVEVNVDDHSTWAVKDRYRVGGYPTLIAVDRTGAEIDRMVGYPGKDATLQWLAQLSQVPPLAHAPAPETTTGTDASTWARRFAEIGQTDTAARFLERAEPNIDAAVARFLGNPTAADAQTLAAANVPVDTWAWSALSLVESHAEVADTIAEAARRSLVVDAANRADHLYLLSRVVPEPQRADLARAAAITLLAQLTGDAHHDRGHWTSLATFWSDAGEPAAAASVLDAAIAAFPNDMTFHEARADLAFDQNDTDTAIHHAQLAVQLGEGDNRLRATALLARALHAAGRTDEARQLVLSTLAETPAPDEALNVRTHRYRSQLRALPFVEATPN